MASISVIIPTYNRAAFVERAVEAVIHQTFKDVEIVVVDDGSIDNTKETLAKYNELPGYQYIYQSNKGRSIARNEGAKRSSGEWIMYLDSDDYLEPNALALLYEFASQSNESGVVYGNFKFFRKGQAPSNYNDPLVGSEKGTNLFLALLEDKNCLAKTGTYLIRKELDADMFGFDEAYEPCEDLHYSLRLLRKYKASYIPDIVLQVEQHGTNTDNSDMQKAIIKICKYYLHSNEWKAGLTVAEIKRANEALQFRIANGLYELDQQWASFGYYTRLVSSKPSALLNRFVRKQLAASMIPAGLKRMIKKKNAQPKTSRAQ